MSNIELQPGFDFQQAGKEVLQIEREGLAQLDSYINADFTRACETIAACGGKVVVMGMGKSGHIGCKIAATFASTGTLILRSPGGGQPWRFGHGHPAGHRARHLQLRRIQRDPGADPGIETPADHPHLYD